jgi:hypothetical protein
LKMVSLSACQPDLPMTKICPITQHLGGMLRDAAAKAVHTYRIMCEYLHVRARVDFDLDQCTTKEWSKLKFYICTRTQSWSLCCTV